MSDLFYNNNVETKKNDKATVVGSDDTEAKVSTFAKGIKGIKKGIKAGISVIPKDVKDFGKGTLETLKSDFTPKSLKNKQPDLPISYGYESVSIANRNTDAITGILNKTFDGNLFDAGVSALTLYNTGTKWSIAYKQEVDRNIYPFKYNYSYGNNGGDIATSDEEDAPRNSTFLDDIEDPTILGFALRIDYSNSPLFNGVAKDSILNYGAKNFIDTYLKEHREMAYANSYLAEFYDMCNKIFISPEIESDFYKTKYKNSYIYQIDGLDKLDNRFVNSGKDDTDHDTLDLTIGEDLRMYVNRMYYLYKNLIWSNNMCKKLIPENLLRFNLYIKISDIRNFTNGIKKNNGVVEDDDGLTNAIRNGYSRVIYELKDCEFLFDKSLSPNNLIIGGFGDVNNTTASLKLKIKYRKVNRIFFSQLFNKELLPTVIGDRDYIPNIDTYYNSIDGIFKTGIEKGKSNKNVSTNNNIPAVVSLSSRLETLKTNGLFSPSNSDSAGSSFVKSLGNKAVKTGASVLDDGVQKVKGKINDFGKEKLTNNKLSSAVKDVLKNNIFGKTTTLDSQKDKVNPDAINTNKKLDEKIDIIDIKINVNDKLTDKDKVNPILTNVKNDIKEDKYVYDDNDDDNEYNDDIININDKLTDKDKVNPIINPIIDTPTDKYIYDDIDDIINVNDKLDKDNVNPIVNNIIVSPIDNINGVSNDVVIEPNDNVNGASNNVIIEPNSNVYSDVNHDIIEPNSNVNGSSNDVIIAPNSNVNEIGNKKSIKTPIGNVADKKSSNIETPIDNVNKSSKSSITSPNSNVNPIIKDVIETPDANVNDNFNKFIKKIKTPPSNSEIDGLAEN